MGVDSIVALAKRKPITADKALKKIAPNDYLFVIDKPKDNAQIKKRYDQSMWACIPKKLKMRQIKVTVSTAGFRVKTYYIWTTLLNEIKYPAQLISDLYWERWQVELNFRDIKSTLGMDVLKSKTPEMVKKEILMYVIVFNVLRQLMYDSSAEHLPNQMSFKSSIQTLLGYCRQYGSKAEQMIRFCHQKLLSEIEQCLLYQRKGRIEPRQLKRRQRPFKLLMKPRHEVINDLRLERA